VKVKVEEWKEDKKEGGAGGEGKEEEVEKEVIARQRKGRAGGRALRGNAAAAVVASPATGGCDAGAIGKRKAPGCGYHGGVVNIEGGGERGRRRGQVGRRRGGGGRAVGPLDLANAEEEGENKGAEDEEDEAEEEEEEDEEEEDDDDNNDDDDDDDNDDNDDEKEEEAEEDEEPPKKGGEVSTVFTSYKPKKLTIGRPHPAKVVETSVLARAEPPDIWYKLHPGMDQIVQDGRLSSAQLESIIYATQQHERTVVNGEEVGGYFIGDGGRVGGNGGGAKGAREGVCLLSEHHTTNVPYFPLPPPSSLPFSPQRAWAKGAPSPA